MVLALGVAPPLLSKKGGDLIVIAVTPEGQINHYWIRSFGKKFGGRAWAPKTGLPPNTKKLTVMSPFSDRVGGDWMAPYDMINWAKSWPDVIGDLKGRYGDKAKVAVIPDATIQYFPDAPEV